MSKEMIVGNWEINPETGEVRNRHTKKVVDYFKGLISFKNKKETS